jgi:Rrf2 family nitric oxide-sensitive transcriptional repressor
MKLTQYSDLGLRMLMYLALRYGNTSTIQEVSVRFAVSKNHMVKISHQLTKSGLIESVRGRNGGIRLAKPPESISVEEALYATEDNFDFVECFGPDNHCIISDVCKLSGVLNNARKAFFSVLRQVSLADLVKGGKTLEKTLLPFAEEKIVKFYPRYSSSAKRKSM